MSGVCCKRKPRTWNGWRRRFRCGPSSAQHVQRVGLVRAGGDGSCGQEANRLLGGHADSALLIDESGCPKQGTHSVGVARQWCGQLGKVENCQVGVFAALSRGTGVTLIDERLFLPEAWTNDPARCQAAGSNFSITHGTASAADARSRTISGKGGSHQPARSGRSGSPRTRSRVSGRSSSGSQRCRGSVAPSHCAFRR